jgi:hypothetical protein
VFFKVQPSIDDIQNTVLISGTSAGGTPCVRVRTQLNIGILIIVFERLLVTSDTSADNAISLTQQVAVQVRVRGEEARMLMGHVRSGRHKRQRRRNAVAMVDGVTKNTVTVLLAKRRLVSATLGNQHAFCEFSRRCASSLVTGGSTGLEGTVTPADALAILVTEM